MTDLLAELTRIDAWITPGPLTVEVDTSRKYAWLYDAEGRLVNGRFGITPTNANGIAALRNLLPAMIAKLRDAGERDTRLGAAESLGGKTPWEFACAWYGENEIIDAVQRNMIGAMDARPIPPDVHSEAFGKWLVHEYRLAMRKGIEIGQRDAARAALAPQENV